MKSNESRFTGDRHWSNEVEWIQIYRRPLLVERSRMNPGLQETVTGLMKSNESRFTGDRHWSNEVEWIQVYRRPSLVEWIQVYRRPSLVEWSRMNPGLQATVTGRMKSNESRFAGDHWSNESSKHLMNLISFRHILILFSYLCLSVSDGPFRSGVPTKMTNTSLEGPTLSWASWYHMRAGKET
jgi:desulfoferrodoxin (superoxide reductase-like protein)